jgi:hypothetical protein
MAIFKPCQYGETKEKKITKKFKYFYIKSTQFYLQKCITWLKNPIKSKQDWNKDYIDFRIHKKIKNSW